MNVTVFLFRKMQINSSVLLRCNGGAKLSCYESGYLGILAEVQVLTSLRTLRSGCKLNIHKAVTTRVIPPAFERDI